MAGSDFRCRWRKTRQIYPEVFKMNPPSESCMTESRSDRPTFDHIVKTLDDMPEVSCLHDVGESDEIDST